MTLLWQKADAAPDAAMQRFVAGGDAVVDRAIFRHDIEATAAHTRGLARIGVLSADEATRIAACLDELRAAFDAGTFALDDRFEDGHSAIEWFVTERLGDAGKRLHTGRSRNDQVAVALRLYMRDAVDALIARTDACARAFLLRAEADAMTPLPGYTHLQRAVPSSVGLWLGSFAEAMLDDRDLARAVRPTIDTCPLGTGAGYGVNVALDREGVAAELRFARVQLNPMYVQNSRGKLELTVLHAIGSALLDVRRFAWDLSLFPTSESAFVKLPVAFTTGSSLMPQKRNPDVVELLRAVYAEIAGASAEIASALSLPSGYQRDLQVTKAPLVRAVERGLDALALLPRLVGGMELDRDRMRAAITPEMFATDRALELALAGVPFRDAYRDVGRTAEESLGRTPEASLVARISLGSCGALGLDRMRARLG